MSGTTNISAPTRIIECLTAIIFNLQKYLAAESHRLRADPAIVTPAWNRLGRLLRQFCALAVTPPKPLRPYAPRTPNPDQPRTPPSSIFPRQRGWLRRLVPSHWINGAIGDMRDLIESADMIARVALNPRLKPILRSYCFMLGIPAQPHLKAEPRPRKPRTTPRAPKPPKPRAPKPFKSLTRADLFKPHPLPFESDPPTPRHRNFFKRT